MQLYSGALVLRTDVREYTARSVQLRDVRPRVQFHGIVSQRCLRSDWLRNLRAGA